jgi:hypothetical protein
MLSRTLRPVRGHLLAGAALAAIALGSACTETPPPKEPPATKSQPPPPEAPPPAPPACVSLSEKCQATGETEAKVPGTALVFNPPDGWLYAQEEEVTLAQTPDGGPCLAMASFEKVGDFEGARTEVVDLLIRSVGVGLPEPPKGKPLIDWAEADAEQEIAGFKMGMWQREGASRVSIEGPLLMFSFDADDTHRVIGLGFAPKDDPAQSDKKILQAIESLRAVESDSDQGGGDQDGEAEEEGGGS